MVQVGDESDREAGIRERLPGDARLAVTERTLGVEDVRDARRAGVGSRGHVRSDGLGVPERDPHAGVDDALDGVDGAGAFGAIVSRAMPPAACKRRSTDA